MPGLVVNPRSRIFHGHDWVYANEVKKAFGDPQPGEVVTLKDFKDRPLGSAIYNPASQIVARRISRRKQELDAAFFERRIRRAAALRESMGFGEGGADGSDDGRVYRLVWSEADGLPGVVVDRYGDHFALQTLTLAMDRRKELVVAALRDVFDAAAVVERNDSPIRKAEGLEPSTGVLAGEWNGPLKFEIGGVRQEVDLREGQKTGLYLDQFDNYAAVASRARGRSVLDCFCNRGGFALHAARAGAESVLAVDASEGAVRATEADAERNGLAVATAEANAFDFLKEAEEAGRRFDLVVLDPPSFSRNRKAVGRALRGYKEIHLRASKLLAPDGFLTTFCCSHHVTEREFFDVICDASVDAKRSLRVVERHGQRRDHPVVATIPETGYLKGYTFQAMAGF